MQPNFMGAIGSALGGNFSGALSQMVPGIQPFMPILSALEKRLKRDGRDQLQEQDIVKVHIVKDDTTRMLSISQSQMIRQGLNGSNNTRTASMVTGVT